MYWNQEQIKEHYMHPCNKGIIEAPSFISQCYNPSCGDRVQIYGSLNGDVIEKIMFQGEGCVIAMATASLLTVDVQQKKVQNVNLYGAQYIQSLIGMSLGPVRLKCALLSLQALQQGLSLE